MLINDKEGTHFMQVQAIHTEIFSQGEDIIDFVVKSAASKLKEKSVLAITSKIVSLAENRIVNKEGVNKTELIQQEAQHYLGEIGYGCHLTIKHGLLVPSAGIDESNSIDNKYILYPKNPFASAEKICRAIKQKFSLHDFAVVITDSRTFPLRKGVIGVALAYSGFKAVKSLIGKEDLFGRALRITTINLVDALAASAVLLMGEGAEQCPLAVVYEAPLIFTDKTDSAELNIPVEEDLYKPLYKHGIDDFKD